MQDLLAPFHRASSKTHEEKAHHDEEGNASDERGSQRDDTRDVQRVRDNLGTAELYR